MIKPPKTLETPHVQMLPSYEDTALDRAQFEKYFMGPTGRIIDAIKLPQQYEDSQITKIKAMTIDSSCPTPEQIKRMESSFPSGTFLFHSAKTSSIVEILKSGFLVNAGAIGQESHANNGGSEGISWSLSDIEAMPATRYHIAGFVAAPETVLGHDSQLAVPDAAAPFEVVQLSSKIDSNLFYRTFAQARALERQYYAIREFDALQAAAIRDRILAQKAFLKDEVSGQTAIRVPIDKLYLVAPYRDIDTWAKVLARCGNKPAGIIAYDGDTVMMEDFVQDHRGDGRFLAEHIRAVVTAKGEKTLRFDDLLATPFDDFMRNPEAPHTMDDAYRMGSKRVILDNDRRLQLIE